MADDRNCMECKHHVPLKPGSDICGCEKWECEFEPKEECTKAGVRMNQYCRYCVYLCVNNAPYCDAKKEFRSVKSCKRPNKCKDFVLCESEPEYQDAFGETNGYKPRAKHTRVNHTGEIDCQQMSFFEQGVSK